MPEKGNIMKKKKPNPYLIDDENPEWTEADFRGAVSGREFFTKLWGKKKAEEFFARYPGSRKKAKIVKPISIRLTPEVEEFFRATGKGWQTRINTVLSEWVAAHS